MGITLLTEPVTFPSKLKEGGKRIIGHHKKFGGHYAVTRSLCEGLNKIGYKEYNYRPKSENQLFEHVHVLAGVNTLKYAIDLKKRGKIKYLTAGPNVVVFSTDYNYIICNPLIDIYVQPSKWAADFHKKLTPEIANKVKIWPAGVDIAKYKPSLVKDVKKNKVIIYHKDESYQFCWRLHYWLRQYGFDPVIIKYGDYKLEEYIKELNEALFNVVLARQESQGIYLAESWAMDVPTVCYEPYYYKWPYGDNAYELFGNISTCPYQTEKTGIIFTEIDEFKSILSNWNSLSSRFSPRKWVEENMTDEICARKFLETVQIKQ